MKQATTVSLRNRVIPTITVAIVLALLGLLAYAVLAQRARSDVQGGVRVNTNVGSLIRLGGQPAPDFALTGFDGEPLSLEQFRGKTVVLNFWASWCPPCKDEAPILAELGRTLDPDQYAVVGVAIWDKEADARDFLRQYGLNYPNGFDARGAVAVDYGVAGVPETYFIGPEGELLGKYPGPLTSVEQVQDMLREVAGGE